MNTMLVSSQAPEPPARVDRDSFVEHGFVSIPRLVGGDTIGALREAYDDILDRRVKANGDRYLGNVTRQVMRPHEAHETFRDNDARRAAARIAAALFGGAPSLLYDMLIYKPPGHPEETPWHQDLAYAGMPTLAAGTPPPNVQLAQFWVALDDTDQENGCMHFVPGVHRDPLLPHIVASGDPTDESRLLAIEDPERHLPLKTAVACPLSTGGATVHGYNTPHYTPPNRSANRPRRAYIFTYAVTAA